MKKTALSGLLILAALVFPAVLLCQDTAAAEAGGLGDRAQNSGTIPFTLRIPQRGEASRHPRDMVIGDLGRGTASEGAFSLAQRILRDLLLENQTGVLASVQDKGLIDRILEELKVINPKKFRLGGGREEADGTVSFLVRFLGREQGIAAELYLKAGDGRWSLDDLILEEPRDTGVGKDAYRFDFAPYERFF